MDAEARANDLANSNSVGIIQSPGEMGSIEAGNGGPVKGHALIEGRDWGKTDPTLYVGRVRDSHSRGIHEIQEASCVGGRSGGECKLKRGIRSDGGGKRARGGARNSGRGHRKGWNIEDIGV